MTLSNRKYVDESVNLSFNRACGDEVFKDMFRKRVRLYNPPNSDRIVMEVTRDTSYGSVIETRQNGARSFRFPLSRSRCERLGFELGKRYFIRALHSPDPTRFFYVFDPLKVEEPNIRFNGPVVSVGKQFAKRYRDPQKIAVEYVPVSVAA